MNPPAKGRKGKLLKFLKVATLRGVGALALFLMYYAIAQNLEIGESGILLWNLTIVTILAPISLGGIHVLALRLLSASAHQPESPTQISSLIKTTTKLATIFTLIVTLLFGIIATPTLGHFQVPSFRPEILLVLLPAATLNALSLLFAHQLQGVGSQEKSLYAMTISTPILATIAIALIKPTTALLAAEIYLGASVATFATAAFWISRLTDLKSPTVEIDDLFSRSSSLFVVSLMVVVVNWGPQLISGAFVSSEDVAVFSVSQRAANVVSFILIIANYIVSPIIARHWAEKDMAALDQLALRSTAYMSIVGAAATLVIMFFSRDIMGLFGQQYRSGGLILSIVALGQFINVATGSVNAMLSMTGHEKALRSVLLFSGTTSLILSIIAIKWFGIVGGATIVTLCLILQNIYAIQQLKKCTGINIWHAYKPSNLLKLK